MEDNTKNYNNNNNNNKRGDNKNLKFNDRKAFIDY